jgi:hypothetical protein
MLIGSTALFLLAAILFVGFFIPPSLAMAQLQQQQQQQQQQTTTTTTTTLPPSSSLSITTIPPLTLEEQEQQNRLQNVIAATTRDLNETEKQVSGVVFTPRWSEPVWVNANSIAVIVAYCLPGEFADSGQEILGGFGLEVLESYAVDLPQGFMAWMAVVGNEDGNVRLPAALGVICASDLNRPDTRILSPQEQQEINNVISQFTTIQNTQITNIDQVINIINNVTTPQNGTGGGGGMTPPTEGQPLTVKIIPNATEGVYFASAFKFEASVTGGTEPYTYSWDTINYDIYDLGHTFEPQRGNEKTFEFVGPWPDKYNVTLTVTDSKNQTASDNVQVTVIPPESPTVEIIPNATEGVAAATFRFETNVNAGSLPYAWVWNFGDGQYIDAGPNPTVEHTFKRAGTYNVVVQVGAVGGGASDSIVITVKERGPQGGVTVEPTIPPTVPGGGEEQGNTGGGRRPQGGVTVGPSQEPGVPPPTVPGDTAGGEEGDTGGGRGPQGGVTVEPTEEPEGEGEEPSPDEEPTIPPGGQPP